MLFYLIEKLLWNWVMAPPPLFFRPRHAFKISMSRSGAMTREKKKSKADKLKGLLAFKFIEHVVKTM